MSFLDLLYPKRCPVCLDPLPPGRQLICSPCKKRIPHVTGPACMKCGKPLSDENFEYCGNCEKRMPAFEKGLAWAEYADANIRRMLAEVKYHENAQILDFPCLDFAERIRPEIERFDAEVLIPAPIHASKLPVRGYNQAEEIADRLGTHLGLPVDPNYLIRREKTKAQKELGQTERRNNLATAFVVPPSEKSYHRVILVDDIYTTGSTADACTRALLDAGVEKVLFLTLATGRDRRLLL